MTKIVFVQYEDSEYGYFTDKPVDEEIKATKWCWKCTRVNGVMGLTHCEEHDTLLKEAIAERKEALLSDMQSIVHGGNDK